MNEQDAVFMRELYSRVKRNTISIDNMYDIGEKIGLSRDDSFSAANLLREKGLIRFQTHDGGVSITALGIDYVEEQ